MPSSKRRRIHPLLRRKPSATPATMHPGQVAHPPALKPRPRPARPPVEVRAPDLPAGPGVGLSRPRGPGGGSPPPPPHTITGTQPPPTVNNWLHGVGTEITPGPAMSAVGVLLAKTGIYAAAQAANTWAKISHKRSTV